MQIVIRDYQKSDDKVLRKLFEDFQDYFVHLDDMKRERRLAGYGEQYLLDILEKLEKNNGKAYIAEKDGMIVGFVMGIIKEQSRVELLGTIPTRTGEVLELYVDALYRAQGVGTKLLNKMEAYFKEEECTISWIGVFELNMPARNFYSKQGYKDRLRYVIKEL